MRRFHVEELASQRHIIQPCPDVHTFSVVSLAEHSEPGSNVSAAEVDKPSPPVNQTESSGHESCIDGTPEASLDSDMLSISSFSQDTEGNKVSL